MLLEMCRLMENKMFGVLVLLQELAVLLEELGFPPAHLDLGQPLCTNMSELPMFAARAELEL